MSAVPDEHNARTSLDWSGTYEGVIPCADCPGIDTCLSLGSDETYELEARYLERSPPPRIERGAFRWLPDGNTIELDEAGASQLYFVSENRVILLGQDGEMPTGVLAARYVLQKVAGCGDQPTSEYAE